MTSRDTEERREPGPSGWWPVPDRSLLPTVLGLPAWASVGLAAALTALGVSIDLFRVGALGGIFTVCFVVGCLLAVAWVRRDSLFWTLVQPPLLVAVTVPVVVLLARSPRTDTGFAEQALVLGAPLVNAFPVMAMTTGLTLAVGAYRMATQRLRRPRRAASAARPVSSRRGSAADEARGAARSSASPPPS